MNINYYKKYWFCAIKINFMHICFSIKILLIYKLYTISEVWYIKTFIDCCVSKYKNYSYSFIKFKLTNYNIVTSG